VDGGGGRAFSVNRTLSFQEFVLPYLLMDVFGMDVRRMPRFPHLTASSGLRNSKTIRKEIDWSVDV
jgi:hypothetical protein